MLTGRSLEEEERQVCLDSIAIQCALLFLQREQANHR